MPSNRPPRSKRPLTVVIKTSQTRFLNLMPPCIDHDSLQSDFLVYLGHGFQTEGRKISQGDANLLT